MSDNLKLNKKKILNNHLETIFGIANQDYQERVWIRGEGPEVDDYTESMCHFFDDGDPIIANYKEYAITKKQLSLLLKLREAIEDFNSNTRFELGPNFTDSPEWKKIILIAKEVLHEFDYQQIKNIKDDIIPS